MTPFAGVGKTPLGNQPSGGGEQADASLALPSSDTTSATPNAAPDHRPPTKVPTVRHGSTVSESTRPKAHGGLACVRGARNRHDHTRGRNAGLLRVGVFSSTWNIPRRAGSGRRISSRRVESTCEVRGRCVVCWVIELDRKLVQRDVHG